jgi:NTE family protein
MNFVPFDLPTKSSNSSAPTIVTTTRRSLLSVLPTLAALQACSSLAGAGTSTSQGQTNQAPSMAGSNPSANNNSVTATSTTGATNTVTARPTVTNQRARLKPKIGLALGGGAARGFAHVGVISVLEAAGIQPDWIVGTSAGSLVGALYASGLSASALRTQALALDESLLGDWQFNSRGVIRGKGLQDYVNRLVGQRRIEQFPRRFAATATDLYNGNLRLFVSGDCGMVVRASSSVPTVFEPVSFEGREYVDGGLTSPIPVRSTKRLGCDIVIGVDISAKPSYQSTETVGQILLQTFAIMGRSLAEQEMQEADIRLRPDVGDLGAASFESRKRAIEDGERAMRDQLGNLMARIRAFTDQPGL